MPKYTEGECYHIYNRGVEKRKIFTSHNNYLFLIRRIKEYLPAYPLTLIAYCLIPNHYHFLIRANEDNGIGPFLQKLFNCYAQAFNKQEKRSGALFEGRPKSKHIDKSAYLFQVVRYVHLNPLRAGLVSKPENWQYSNYPEYIGVRSGRLYEPIFLQDQFDTPQAYRNFVEDELSNDPVLAKYLF